MADNFDLQGWMREQKQGPYADVNGVEKVTFKSSTPKSKTGLNEGLMGMIDLQPVGRLSEEFTDDDLDSGMNDEEDLDNYFKSYPETNKKTVNHTSKWKPSTYKKLLNLCIEYPDLAQNIIAHMAKISHDETEDWDAKDLAREIMSWVPPKDLQIAFFGEDPEIMDENMEDDMDAPEIEDTWYSDDTEDTMDSMPMDGTDTSFDKIQAGLISVQNKMNSLLAGFKAGSVSKDEYVAKRKMLQGMRDKLEAQLSISDDDLESMEEDI